MDWYAFALISALFSALGAILEKKILFKEKALEFTLVLALFNMILSSAFFAYVDFSAVHSSALLILLIKSVFNAVGFLFVMYAIKNLELSQALPFLVFTPAFIAIFAFIFLGETISIINISGLVCLIAGAYILNLRENQKFFDPFKMLIKLKGYRYVLMALLLFTITSILDRVLLIKQKLPPQALMAYQHIFFALIFLIIFIVKVTKTKDRSIIGTIKSSWIIILMLSIVTIVYRYTEILSVKGTPAVALAIVLKRLSIFFAVVIGGTLFNEHNLIRKTIATIILIIGSVLILI